MEIKEGFFNMTDEKYFSIGPEHNAISNSFLINFDKSPAHGMFGIKKTDSMEKGSLIHSFILDDEKEFDKKYEIVDYFSKSSKDYKMAKFDFPDKIIAKKSDIEEIKIIKDYFLQYEIIPGILIGDIFPHSKKEIAGFYFDMEFGIWKKIKLDLFYNNKELPIVIDIKKSRDPFEFKKSIFAYKYYRQNAFYIDVIKALTGKNPVFYFFALEDKEPYGMRAWRLDEELIEAGRYETKLSIEKYKEWEKLNIDPLPFHPYALTILKPGWMNF
jgi:hypothetical protein